MSILRPVAVLGAVFIATAGCINPAGPSSVGEDEGVGSSDAPLPETRDVLDWTPDHDPAVQTSELFGLNGGALVVDMTAHPDGVFDFTLQLTDEAGDEVMEWFAANYGPTGTGETDPLGLRAFQAVIFKGRPGVVPPGRYALRFDPNKLDGVPGTPGSWRFVVRERAEF